MSCYVHNVPGRLRVRIPAAKGNAAAAAKLVDRLNVLEGVTSVESNIVTGSILVRYDIATTNARACLAILNIQAEREADMPATARGARTPPLTERLVSKAAEAATWYVLEKALERCFPLLLAALI